MTNYVEQSWIFDMFISWIGSIENYLKRLELKNLA